MAHIEKPKEFIKTLLDLASEFSKKAGYKVNILSIIYLFIASLCALPTLLLILRKFLQGN